MKILKKNRSISCTTKNPSYRFVLSSNKINDTKGVSIDKELQEENFGEDVILVQGPSACIC